MTQQRLFKREKPTLPAKQAALAESDRLLARIILEKPDLYAGIQVEWARAVEKREQNTGRLF